MKKVVYLEKKNLKRDLGVGDLFAIGYGDIGSSIYYALGATALYSLGATPISMLIAGFVFICTGLTYAELASTYPESGGSATYSRYAFNDFVSFIAGFGLLLDYIVTIAISAFAISPYIRSIFLAENIHGVGSVPIHLAVTVGVIIFLFLLNLIGIKHSTRFSFFLAVITIASQLLLILLAGVLVLNLPYVISHMRINMPGAAWSPNWGEFAKGTAMAMVAYTGIESIAQLAEETKNPGVSIPRSIKWTMWILVFLYLGISLTGLSVVSPEELGTAYLQNPLLGIISNLPIGGRWLSPVFGLVAAFILLIAANAGLIGSSRLAFSMGAHYQLPQAFYRTSKRFHTPYVSLAVFAGIAIVIVLASRGRMLFLADLYNFGAQIAFFTAHISLLALRWKQPDAPRPYKAPFNLPLGKNRSWPITAVIGAIASFGVWMIVCITKPAGRNLGLIWIGLGLIMFVYYRMKKNISPLGQLKVEKFRISEYQPMHLRHVLVTARALGNTEALETACQLASNFNATLTAVHVIEIPLSLPMDIAMGDREEIGENALKRAEAVAREFELTVELKLIRARSVEGALLQLLSTGNYDLVVIGADKDEMTHHAEFVASAEKFFKDAPCRVILCKT